MLGVFQREVLQLRLQLVQAQLVGQGGVEVCRLVGHAEARLVVLCILYLAHDVDAVGYHDEDDAHVLGKGQEQLAEVLRLDAGAFQVQILHADEAPDDACHVFAEVARHLVGGIGPAAHRVVQHHAQDGRAPHSYLLGHDDCRLHVLDDGVQAEHVARQGRFLHGAYQAFFQPPAIFLLQGVAGEAQ